ncbi:hypothetical protein HY632_02300 [Candidatus Uhrbacteria bacterium]|nr:hypothetical protein [Candidatus Uhrbacteria bacterium]
MLDQETKKFLEEQFETVLRTTEAGFDGVDEQFRRVDERFDAIDLRLKTVESDIADLKHRMSRVEQEIITLGAQMVTKQYLDTKIDALLSQPPINKIDGVRRAVLAVLLHLERAKLLPSEERATLEMLLM